MTVKPTLIDAAQPVTEEELIGALLEMTGDLDKAHVVRSALPSWLVEADSSTLAALEQAHSASQAPRRRLEDRLSRLQPLDRFCVERLHGFLTRRGHLNLDVEHDSLELPRHTLSSVNPDLGGPLSQKITLQRHSLVQAAMQNFPASRAQPGGLWVAALIRSAATGQAAPGISVGEFVGYCRELDLGTAYQAHVREVFHLPAPGETGVALSYNPAAVDIGQGKVQEMQIDLHIALAKQHIGAATHARLLKLIKADLPANAVAHLSPRAKPLIWQGLNLDEACLWSVLVLSDDAPGELVQGPFVIYMPNEPVRPWYEYASLDDFKLYLTLKLQVPSYRVVFARYLDEDERVGFFQRFDRTRTLGTLQSVPVQYNFADFFFKACVGKIQLDARVLAVPKAQADEDARQRRLQAYLDAGLDMLNVAAFVVPVLGQLMLGVAVGQLLAEVFEGVEDWSHHDNAEALRHLISVGENIAGMALFAVGGRVIGSFKRTLTASTAFFEKVEAVRLQDQSPRLWRPRLAPYRQPVELDEASVANAMGVYQANGQSCIRIDDALHVISFDPDIGQWRLNHATRPQAYRPPLAHNGQGGWRHIHEHPEQWPSLPYHLGRLGSGMSEVPSEMLSDVAAITEMKTPDLLRLTQTHEPLPERFQDAVARVEQHREIADLAFHLGYGVTPPRTSVRAQLHALALLPGWPEGRFFKVLASDGKLLERYPDVSPLESADLGIPITEQQLNEGQVMDTLLRALSTEERTALLGESVALEDASGVLTKRLFATVNARHRALYLKLYADYDGVATGELVPLLADFPELPRRMAWELLCSASTLERESLRRNARVPLGLAQRSREALELLEQDHALMGLYWPQLADDSAWRLAFGLLERLPDWPRDLLMELREDSLTGRMLAHAGPQSAAVRRRIVRTEQGFQTFDEQGRDLNVWVSEPHALSQAMIDCLSRRQRLALNLGDARGAERLSARLRFKAQDERTQLARYLWPEREWPVEPAACAQAQLKETATFAPALVRKLKKLYPSFNDVQVAGFLQDAGTDHLSRARAVEALEQAFQALRRALDVWRSDKSAQGSQAIPEWDYHMSRRQAAKAIERCWRRLDGADLVLDGMLPGPLPILPPQIHFDPVQRLSLRRMALTDDVAYFLKHFKSVRTLELAGNRLTRLPEVLSLMPNLEQLLMADNRLQLTEHTRRKLAGLRSLKTLNLADNPLLDPPDVSRLFDLRELILRNCRLKDLPAGLHRLPYLAQVDLRENDIQVLPDWLFDVSRQFAESINLRHNPLAASSRQGLHNFRQRVGVGMGFIADDIARLNEQKARELWMPDESAADYASKSTTWANLRDEAGVDGLFRLLSELDSTADARQVREDLDRRVWRVLEAAAQDSDLREELFERAATPINCDDAAATNFSSLEVLVEIGDASRLIQGGRLTAKPLLRLVRGLFRLDRLERIARRYSAENPTFDPLEVSLAYRTGLVERFQLPGQPRHMRFARLGGVTAEALNSAEAELRTAELSTDLLTYIVQLPIWTDYLKRTFASRFETLNTPFDQRMQAVFDQGLTLDDAVYRERMNVILLEQRQAEKTELERLSLDALKIEEMGLCASALS